MNAFRTCSEIDERKPTAHNESNKNRKRGDALEDSRPANIPAHRARCAERKDTMEEDRKAIIQMIGMVKSGLVMKMIREIVTWLLVHEDELI